MDNLGAVAYEAYREYAHGVSLVSGQTLPPWNELDEGIAGAWQAAAEAVERAANPTPLP